MQEMFAINYIFSQFFPLIHDRPPKRMFVVKTGIPSLNVAFIYPSQPLQCISYISLIFIKIVKYVHSKALRAMCNTCLLIIALCMHYTVYTMPTVIV